MLTDPPNVPAGTTVLNLTYSDIALHLTYSDGTNEWLSVGTSGTVDSFSLVNMSQTIASTTIPTGSKVDKIQFTIVNVDVVINGTTYNVTTLSNTLVLAVANSQINQTLSGVLVDFNPTIVQIQSADTNGTPLSYYVLVPSATASVVNSLDQAQIRVGTIVNLDGRDRDRITNVVEDFSQNISVESASLQMNGNSTSLSVTLKNNGDITFRIFGFMLNGQFNSSQTATTEFQIPNQQPSFDGNRQIDSIPFQINDTSIIPFFRAGPQMQPMNHQDLPPNQLDQPRLTNDNQTTPFGNQQGMPSNFAQMGSPTGPEIQRMNPQNMGPNQPLPPRNDTQNPQQMNPTMIPHDDRNGNASSSYVALQPGQTITLTFNGIIAIPLPNNDTGAISLILGNTYTIHLMGEGYQTYTVIAKN